MERDFMGLNSKREAIEEVLLKSSAFQWSLSNGPEDLNKGPRGPAQLTIFYKGMVNVYDDMSPEKAQAIMLLAHGGKAQVATQRAPTADEVRVGQPINTTLSSPMSVTPSTTRDGLKAVRSFRRVMSDVPQMREASLARFLEKRRERVMASNPYGCKPGPSSAPSKDDKK